MNTPGNRAALRSYIVYFLLASVGILLVSNLLANDTNYVLYRFAAHLANGRGLNYLTPDPTVTTYPLVPLLLSPFASVNPAIGARLLCVISIAAGALFMDRLTAKGWTVGAAYVLAGLINPSPVTLVMLALALMGLDAAHHQRWTVSGILMGLAILAEPAALVPAALVVLLTLRMAKALWRYLLPVVLIPMLVLGLTRLSLGTPNLVLVSIVPEILAVALPILAIFALIRAHITLRDAPTLAILVAWSAAAACLALLRGTWPSVVILPGAIALVSLLSVRYIVVLAAAIDLVLNIPIFPPTPFAIMANGQDIGQWIATHTTPETTVATADIGALAYYADRPLIDLSGRLQSNPFDKDFFLRSAPDVIVLPDNAAVPWSGFKTTYAPVYQTGGQAVYQRVVNFTPLQSRDVNIDFSTNLNRNDLVLTQVAMAQNAHPGNFLRVRLNWQLNYASTRDKAVKLSLIDSQGKTVTTATDKYTADAWPVGPITTYHLLALSSKLPAGDYSVDVALSINNADIGPYKAADLAVTK